MNRCKTCRHWLQRLEPCMREYGECETVADNVEATLDWGGAHLTATDFETGAEFGCVLWEGKES